MTKIRYFQVIELSTGADVTWAFKLRALLENLKRITEHERGKWFLGVVNKIKGGE